MKSSTPCRTGLTPRAAQTSFFLLLTLFGTMLMQPAMAQFVGFQKISDTAGGFSGFLDDGDDFGESVTGLGDLDLDGTPDIAISAEDDDDGGTNRGAVYILFLKPDGTVKSVQKISQTKGGFTGKLSDGDEFGNWIANLGDVDGDGITDLAVNAALDDDGGANRGAIWILFLKRDGTVKGHQKISATQGGFTGELNKNDCFGCSVDGLGDFDHDGIPDLAAGAQHDDDGGLNHGAVWILFLNADGSVKSHQKISSTMGGFTGQLDEKDQFGQSIANMGDLDGDGVTDIAVGAERDDDGLEESGAVWILFLNNDGTVKSHQKISRTQGGFTGDLQSNEDFGQSVESLGDLDGDGVTDLAVGQEFSNYGPRHHRGAFWILYLNADSTVKSYQKIDSYTPGFTEQLKNGDEFGQSISKVGDLNGDGVVDIVVTADGDDDGGPHKGAAYVFFLEGSPSGNGNHTPVLAPIGSRNVVEDQLLTINISAMDSDNDPILLEALSPPPGAEFVDNGNGTGTFTWIPPLGASASSPYSVTFRASDPSGASDTEIVSITVQPASTGNAYVQDSGNQGIVSIEAENYHRNISQGGHDWIQRGHAGASSGTGMRAEPDNRTIVKTNYTQLSPHLDFDIEFVKTGTHYVWIRGYGKNGGSDSVHAGLDGKAVSTAEAIISFNPDKTWVWESRTKNGGRARIDIKSLGKHTLNLWMREDGFFVDKIVITTDAAYVPAGFGPPQSPNGSGSNQPPVLAAIGDRVITEGQMLTINVSASDPDNDPLVLNASPLPPGADFIDNGNGTGIFTWTPSTGTSTNSPYTVIFEASDTQGASDSENVMITVNAPSGTTSFQQDSGIQGLVSMEAENFHRKSSRSGHDWVRRGHGSASGGVGMRAEPETGTNIKTNYATLSPQMDFDITFVKSGTHYIWIRGYGVNSGADSVHAGLDGQTVSSAASIVSFNPDRTWVWENRTKSGQRATIDVTPGAHTLNLWMREDSFFVDKVILTTDPNYVPSGMGPPESPR